MSNNHLERVIPLPEAAERLGIPAEVLTRLVKNGIIKAVQLPSGEIAVSEEETQTTVTRDQFEHLRGNPITVSDAAEKYDVPATTIREWVKREYIRVLMPGYGMTLDEQDVAYCVDVYRDKKLKAGKTSGLRIFDGAGRPYRLKHPERASRRKKTI